MKKFSVEIDEDLWKKFEDTFRASSEEYLVDEEKKPLKDPSVEDVATAEAEAVTETKRRGKQWLNVFVVNGMRDKVMPEANLKAEDDDDVVAKEGMALRRSLKAMTAKVTEQ